MDGISDSMDMGLPHALRPEARGGRREELPHAPTPEARGGGREDQPHAMAVRAQEGAALAGQAAAQHLDGGGGEENSARGSDTGGEWPSSAGSATKGKRPRGGGSWRTRLGVGSGGVAPAPPRFR